jgi:hypothetical protein
LVQWCRGLTYRTLFPLSSNDPTLLTPQNQFLGEKFKIQYVASGRDLLEEKPSTAEHDVVLFAPFDFGTSGAVQFVDGGERSMSPPATHWRGTEKRGLQGVRFDPLPAAVNAVPVRNAR